MAQRDLVQGVRRGQRRAALDGLSRRAHRPSLEELTTSSCGGGGFGGLPAVAVPHPGRLSRPHAEHGRGGLRPIVPGEPATPTPPLAPPCRPGRGLVRKAAGRGRRDELAGGVKTPPTDLSSRSLAGGAAGGRTALHLDVQILRRKPPLGPFKRREAARPRATSSFDRSLKLVIARAHLGRGGANRVSPGARG